MERWGLCFGPAWQTSAADLIAPARAAEAAGFNRITTGEYRNDALTWMALLAAGTSSVPVATTISSIALRHPSVVGEAVAALRDVHGDRIELGLGISHPSEVTDELALRQPTLADLEDYVATVRSVVDGTERSTGTYRAPAHDRRRGIATPVPIMVAALGEVAAKRAATYADGIILTWSPVSWTRRIVELVRAEDDRSGRRTSVWVVVPTLPTEDLRIAREACVRHLRPYLRLPSYHRMLGLAIGDADRIDTAADEQVSDRLAADALGNEFLSGVAALGGRERVSSAIGRAYEGGADAVILYPLDTGAGWREAVNATITTCAPLP